jgi:hypothetical protein
MPSAPLSEFTLRVSAVDGVLDPRTVEELAIELRTVLVDAGVTRLAQVPGTAAPDGTRAAELLAACTFLVTAVQTAEALAKIVQAIRSCVRRHCENRQNLRLNVASIDIDLSAERDIGPVVARLLAAPYRTVTGVRRALIVANARYDDPALAQLRAPTHDADALARVLGNPAIGGFDVDLLADADERTIRRRIAALFAGRDRDDVVLLHFSCHGVKDTRGRLHLAARDTDLAALGATAIPASFINDEMSQTHSMRVILILDCCYSGAFVRGGVPRAANAVHLTDEFAAGNGRIVLTASSATEYAFEDGDLTRSEGHPSVFTRALVTGLTTGEADLDTDGEISIDELYDYTYRQVRARTPDQTPLKWSFGVEGSLVIARSVRPAALPAAILDDLGSDRPVLRLAGIAALRQLAHTGRPAQRAAALAALTRLRDQDDSIQVRSAASQALASGVTAPVTPTPHAGPAPAAGPAVLPQQPYPPAVPVSPPASPGAPRQPQPARPPTAPRVPKLTSAKAALFCAIAATACPVYGMILAIIALVLAGRSAKLIRQEPAVYGGEKLVTWARFLAWSAIVVYGIVLVILIARA